MAGLRSPGVRRPYIGALLILYVLQGFSAPVSAANDLYSVDTVKAAYLYRFAGYVEWPQEAGSANPFVIAVVGDPGVARELRRLLPEHRINQQIGQVREISGLRGLGSAQMLYVGTGHMDILAGLGSSGSKPMLIVTEDEKGLELGSVLNFVTIDNRVRFEVSLTAADRAHLKISAELLSVAVRVRGGRRQTDFSCVPFSLTEDSDAPCALRLASPGRVRTRPLLREPAGRQHAERGGVG
jgi:hypothetical protein